MTSSLSRKVVLFGSDKTEDIHAAYKYKDIKPEWIIHEGDLEYLYAENIFKSPLFKKYFVVLTCIVNDNKENIVRLYLYSDKEKSPSKYFPLDKTDQLNDRCRKVIVGKAGVFFMELILDKKEKGEIFGARSVPERKLWIQKFDEAISKFKSKAIMRSVSDTQSFRSKSNCEECLPPEPVHSHSINYGSFNDDEFSVRRQSNQSLPINLPDGYSCIELTAMQCMEPTADYEEAKLIPPEEFDKDEEMSSTKEISWNDIFYNNVNEDFASILTSIGQTGIYLVRPQLKKNHSNDHAYTLCVYHDSHIHKFAIQQSPDHQYLLTFREGEPSFNDILQLCQYYITHPLHITLKDRSDKYIYLTFPYRNENLYY